MSGVYIECCPFCLEKDFDLIGLKAHLLRGRCVDFNQTEAPAELPAREPQNGGDKK